MTPYKFRFGDLVRIRKGFSLDDVTNAPTGLIRELAALIYRNDKFLIASQAGQYPVSAGKCLNTYYISSPLPPNIKAGINFLYLEEWLELAGNEVHIEEEE